MEEIAVKKKSPYVMMAVNLEGKKMLIVGGGPVAYKRFLQWQYRGAQIHVVAPEFCDGFQREKTSQEGELTLHQRPFKLEDLEGVHLVYIATNLEELNQSVEILCHEKGIWSSRSDCSTPEIQSVAMIERGAIQIGVSTGGKSPVLVAEMKTAIEGALDLEEMEKKMMLMQKLKLRLKADVPDQAQRAQILKGAAQLSLKDLENIMMNDQYVGLINFLPK